MPGERRLAVTGSVAGVVLVAAGVAVLALAGGHSTTHSHRTGISAATESHASSPVARSSVTAQLAADSVAYPAAYPPRDPCSLALVRTVATQHATVDGSGLGSAQTVTVVYHAGSGSDVTELGAWRTDQAGSFDVSVHVPDAAGTAGFVTARTPSAQCSTPVGSRPPGYPPSTGTTAPTGTSTPTGGATVPPTSSGPSTGTTSGSTNGSGTESPGSGATPSNGSPSTGSTDAGDSAGNSTGTTNSAGSSAGSSTGAGSSGPSGSTSTAGGSSETNSHSGAPSSIPTPVAINAQSWGLSTSFLVTTAFILLVLGGLAVLLLARRSG